MRRNIIVDEGRRVREELIKQYGSLDGWIDHLQEMDRQRASKAAKPTGKRQKPVAKKSRVNSKKSKP